jgi:PAS domain S-box-containing protein
MHEEYLQQRIAELEAQVASLEDQITHYTDSNLTTRITTSRDVLRALFDNIQNGLLLLDEKGAIQEINKPLATLLGSIPQALVGQQWNHCYQELAPNFPGDIVFQPANNGCTQSLRRKYRTHDDTTYILDLHTITITLDDATGNYSYIILHVIDVTEYIQLQERLIENERFVANSKLAASIAHGMNSPLQTIQTALDIVNRHDDKAVCDEYLSLAQQEVQHVASTLRQLLDLYQPGGNQSGIVEINSLIERILVLVAPWFEQKQVTVTTSLAENLPGMRGHTDEIRQVVLNLISNALDAMPNGGTLTIQTGVRSRKKNVGKELFLLITDTGCGIEPAHLQRIFEPFVTMKKHGVGLGLAITNQIIQEHGGRIEVESTPGSGSAFTVFFPLLYRRMRVPSWVRLSEYKRMT